MFGLFLGAVSIEAYTAVNNKLTTDAAARTKAAEAEKTKAEAIATKPGGLVRAIVKEEVAAANGNGDNDENMVPPVPAHSDRVLGYSWGQLMAVSIEPPKSTPVGSIACVFGRFGWAADHEMCVKRFANQLSSRANSNLLEQ